MLSYHFLFDIALILLSTKLLGLLTRRFQMPQVVGALLAGLILGPACFNILRETEFIQLVSELGVIVLMFNAGLQTDLSELRRTGKAAFIVALMGVILPLAGGFLLAYFFNNETLTGGTSPVLLQDIFIGVILTATSVSISVETLKELGKLSTVVGNIILGAALIDDILGIIALTVITSFAGESVNVFWLLAKILLFFVFTGVIGYLFYLFFSRWVKAHNKDLRRFSIVAFSFCLLLAYIAERFFGVADITGAFLAGLVISNTERTKYIASRFEILSYMLLSPIFFASIGISVELPAMSLNIIIFSVLLLVIAVLSKILGCGIGSKLCGYSMRESFQTGVGMISRGEVALIVASKGNALGLMSPVFFGPTIIMVVVTTIITPIFLKLAFKLKRGEHDGMLQSDLVEKYEEIDQLELVDQDILNMDARLRQHKQDHSKGKRPDI
jgi:Kef-type K+ transport system membrane component KefB